MRCLGLSVLGASYLGHIRSIVAKQLLPPLFFSRLSLFLSLVAQSGGAARERREQRVRSSAADEQIITSVRSNQKSMVAELRRITVWKIET